ncbi:MAG: MFS transporter, partial [Chloroflexota bacterium]
SQFFVPAAAAALPGVAGRESVGQANGLLQVATSLVLVVAPGAAAGAFATIGPHGLVVALIGVYLASVPFLALVPASGPAEDQPPKRAVLAELHAGLRYVAGAPRLTGLIAVALLATLGTGALGVLDVVFVTRALHQPPEAAGVLLTATGLGHLAGGVVAALLGRRLAHRYHVLLGAAVSAEGLAVLAYAFTPTLALAAVALFVLGVLFLLAGVSFVTLIQLATDDRYRGRVMSLVNTGMALAVLVSTGAVGALADVFGVRPVIAATAAILSAAGIVSVVAVSGGPGQRGQAGLPVSAAVEPEQC